jgi:pyrrolysine biosynthesis protein PylC
MRLLVAGGGLQGVEAAFLAKRAGWATALVDKRPEPPARLLAGSFRQMDVLEASDDALASLAAGFDAVLPALEDQEAIDRLAALSRAGAIPVVAIDPEAYRISSSKIRSKALFARLGLPTPEPWRPGAAGPFVAKPSGLSGSRGVRYFESSSELLAAIPDAAGRDDLVIERKLSGPQYSIEVTAKAGKARAWQATALEMDADSDCRLVLAPAPLPPARRRELAAMAEKIAGEIGLTGLMDLEAILGNDGFSLLEIDARLPSQTPTAVWRSTGVNLLVELVRCYVDLPGPPPPPGPPEARRLALYYHVQIKNGALSGPGEHVMAFKGPLREIEGWPGADFALAAGGPGDLAATLVHSAELPEELKEAPGA